MWLKLENNHPARTYFICMNVLCECYMNGCCMNLTIYNIPLKRQ
jgi:hypothetical protein